jgi:hypothetical protein
MKLLIIINQGSCFTYVYFLGYRGSSFPLSGIFHCENKPYAFFYVQQASLLLLEVLKGDNSEDAEWQTRLIEINILANQPQVVDGVC